MYLANTRVCNTVRTLKKNKTKNAQVYKDIPKVHTSQDAHLIHRENFQKEHIYSLKKFLTSIYNSLEL